MSHTFVEPASNPLSKSSAIVGLPVDAGVAVHLDGKCRCEDSAQHDSVAAEEGAARVVSDCKGSEEVESVLIEA